MTLEELITEEGMLNQRGTPFGIDPSINYNRKEFVKRAGALFDAEEYYDKLCKDINDTGARDDMKGLAWGFMAGDDEAKNAQLGTSELVKEQGKALLEEGQFSMAKFVEGKRNRLLDELSVKQLYSLFQRIPLYKTGNKDYDRIANLREKVMMLNQAQKEGHDVGQLVQKELGELLKGVSKEQQVFIKRNYAQIVPHLTNSIIRSICDAFDNLFRDKEEKLNKQMIMEYLKANYKIAENFIDEAPEGEKVKYWNDNLKFQYVEIARELYGSEKKDQKKEDYPEKEARKDFAKSLDIRT